MNPEAESTLSVPKVTQHQIDPMQPTTDHINVFIPCRAEYHGMIEDCLGSIRQFVDHPIDSIVVVSDAPVKIDGTVFLSDKDFWHIIDPEFQYSALYDMPWYRQQIMKLSVDKLFTNNVLIPDPEIVFLRKTKFIENNKFKFYQRDLHMHFGLELPVLLFDADMSHSLEFTTDCLFFSCRLLESMKNTIQEKNQTNWLQVIQDYVIHAGIKLAEPEVYANYVLTYHRDIVYETFPVISFGHIYEERCHTPLERILPKILKTFNQDYIAINIKRPMHWNDLSEKEFLIFYEKVRAPTWPDCFKVEDFFLLPHHIQSECIEIHQALSYVPRLNVLYQSQETS